MIFSYFILLLTCLLLGVNNNNSKSMLTIVFFGVIILASSMWRGYDTENFIAAYDEAISYKNYIIEEQAWRLSIVYCYIEYLFVKFKVLNFFLFKFYLLTIIFLFIYKGLNKFKPNWFLLIFFYLIGTFFDDAMQLRNTLSLGILMYAIYNLYQPNKKKILIYSLLILLATLNHITFIIFFFFLILGFNFSFKDKLINIIFCSSLGLYFFIFIFQNFSIFYYLKLWLSFDKFEGGFETVTRFGSILGLFFYLINYYTIKYIHNHINKLYYVNMKYNLYNTRISKKSFHYTGLSELSLFIFRFTKLMAIPLFMCVLSLTSIRFFRDVELIWLCYISIILSSKLVKKNVKTKVFFLTLTSSLYFMYLSNFIMGPPEDIIYSVFDGDFSLIFK